MNSENVANLCPPPLGLLLVEEAGVSRFRCSLPTLARLVTPPDEAPDQGEAPSRRGEGQLAGGFGRCSEA